MPEIAPWENPNLPAPFATIEREIENRTRRFALWHWDERLVWRDLDYSQLWWATLDVATSVDDWERAIERGRFGRAFTEECNKTIKGKRLGLSSACTFHLNGTFCIIVSDSGAGIARAKAANVWLQFTPFNDEHTKRKRERSPSVWHPNRYFFGVTREVVRAFAPVLLEQFSRGLQYLVNQGKNAHSLQILRDLVALSVYQKILFIEWMRIHICLYRRIITRLDLPVESYLSVAGERKNANGIHLTFGVADEYQRWNIETSVPLVTTMHELLELQLRLREALRPILSAAEIEEILTVPARQ